MSTTASSTAALPYVDEHSLEVAAGPAAAWDALLAVVDRSFGGPAVPRAAVLLGCEQRRAAGPRPLREGSELPGFRVALAKPSSELALVGRHRFSAYALSFRLEQPPGGATRIRAETRAAFPGLAGSAYRALVIGTHLHVLVVRRMLAATRRRAEWA